MGPHPAFQRDGAGAISRHGERAPRRPALPRLGNRHGLLRAAAARSAARDRPADADCVSGDVRPLQPPSRSRDGVLAGDRERRGLARRRRRPGPAAREPDRGAGKRDRPLAGEEPRTDRARRGSDRSVPAAGCPGRPAVGPAPSTSRRPAGRAAAHRGQRGRRRRDGELLPHDQPDGGLSEASARRSPTSSGPARHGRSPRA